MCENEIISVCTGQNHYAGTLNEGDVVELKVIEGSDFENNIGVFNAKGIQCGSIIHNRFDSDIVEGIFNNDMIIDLMYDYDWIVVKAYKSKSFLKAVPKAVEEVSLDEVEAMELHMVNLKESIHAMIGALADIQDDILLLQHLKTQIESAIKLHNELSNEVVMLQNKLADSKSTTKVFDYYSKEAAK